MTPEELRRKAAAIRKQADERFAAAEKIADKEQYQAEFRAVDELLKEAQALTDQAAQAEAEEESRNREAERIRQQLAQHRQQSGNAGGNRPTPTGGNQIEPGEQEDDRTRSLNDWFLQVAMAADPNVSSEARHRLERVYGSEYRDWRSAPQGSERRTMSISSGISGGYLMPTQYRAEVMRIASEVAIVRPRAFVMPMDALELEYPVLDQTSVPSAGSTSYFGGVVADWTADDAEKPETEPRFRLERLKAHELAGYTEVPRTLLRHSTVSVDTLLRDLFAGAIAWFEDQAFLTGNGTGKPLGIQNAPAMITTAARGSASAITMANAIAVFTRLFRQGRVNAVWLMSHAAEATYLQMTGTANTVVIPTGFYVTPETGNSAASQPINYALLGRPALVTEKLGALNTAGDFGLYDFTQYVIGDPGMLEVATSEHFKFRNNRICYRFIHHVGGMPRMSGPITLSDGSTTVSPFVRLGVQ